MHGHKKVKDDWKRRRQSFKKSNRIEETDRDNNWKRHQKRDRYFDDENDDENDDESEDISRFG